MPPTQAGCTEWSGKHKASGHRSVRGQQEWTAPGLGHRPAWEWGGGRKWADPFLGSQAPIWVLHSTHGVVRMEDVGGRGVVQDEHPPQVSAQPAQVLHVVPAVEDT